MSELRKACEYAGTVAGLTATSGDDGLLNQMSANFAYKNVKQGELEAQRALYIGGLQSQEKPMSIAKSIALWEETVDGQELILLKREIEAMKALIKSVESFEFSRRAEIRLQH